MFYHVNKKEVVECSPSSLYQYRVYIGEHCINPTQYNSYWSISGNRVICQTASEPFLSNAMCVEIFGYTPETRTSTFNHPAELPYINGCSTKQLIPPARPGDPTFQLLHIPSYTSEQAHHIHPTDRVVYVADGNGFAVIGSSTHSTTVPLEPGQIIILPRMVAHHFVTLHHSLTVIPLHIFSSVAGHDYDHPMFNGTHRVN